MKVVLCCCIFIALFNSLHTQTIQGIIKDRETQEPLPFVNIVINGGNHGTTSDINGRFTLQLPRDARFLVFSYLGYEKDTFYLDARHDFLEILLRKKAYTLNEVVILPKENPAHRIIDSVISHASQHNPLNYLSFYALLYSKFMITIDKDTLLERYKKTGDSAYVKLIQFVDNQHFLFMENVSEKFYTKNVLNHQRVIAARVSGFRDPYLTLINTQIQPFSFYKPFIVISDKKYVNPISFGSTKKYFFQLEDTLFDQHDTIFVISYRPLRGKQFDGLKGVLYIHSAGWAIKSVIAEPNEPIRGFSIRIKQSYFRPDSNRWFPKELQTDLIFRSPQMKNLPLIGRGFTFIREVSFDTSFSAKKLTATDIYIDPRAMEKDSNELNQYRVTPLSEREKRTYHVLDSLSKKENLQRVYEAFTMLLEGQIPLKWLSIHIPELLIYNKAEGYRPGLKLSTNYRLSEIFDVFAYTGWGLKDNKLKWSVGSTMYFSKLRQQYLQVAYQVWTEETGKSTMELFNSIFEPSTYRNYFLTSLNYKEGIHFSYHSLLKRNIESQWKIFYEQISSPSYMLDGQYINGQFVGTNFFTTYGYSLFFSTLYHLHQIQMPHRRIVIVANNDAWQFNVSWTHYLQLEAWKKRPGFKLLAEAKKQFTTKYHGTFHVRAMIGYASPTLPHALTFHAPANYQRWGIFSHASFETMRMNEFYSTAFLDILGEYALKNVFWKGTTYFAPYPTLTYHGLWGIYRTKTITDFSFQTPDKGYHEITLSIQGLWQYNQIDVGISCSYRLGVYAFSNFKDNIAFKFRIKTFLF